MKSIKVLLVSSAIFLSACTNKNNPSVLPPDITVQGAGVSGQGEAENPESSYEFTASIERGKKAPEFIFTFLRNVNGQAGDATNIHVLPHLEDVEGELVPSESSDPSAFGIVSTTGCNKQLTKATEKCYVRVKFLKPNELGYRNAFLSIGQGENQRSFYMAVNVHTPDINPSYQLFLDSVDYTDVGFPGLETPNMALNTSFNKTLVIYNNGDVPLTFLRNDIVSDKPQDPEVNPWDVGSSSGALLITQNSCGVLKVGGSCSIRVNLKAPTLSQGWINHALNPVFLADGQEISRPMFFNVSIGVNDHFTLISDGINLHEDGSFPLGSIELPGGKISKIMVFKNEGDLTANNFSLNWWRGEDGLGEQTPGPFKIVSNTCTTVAKGKKCYIRMDLDPANVLRDNPTPGDMLQIHYEVDGDQRVFNVFPFVDVVFKEYDLARILHLDLPMNWESPFMESRFFFGAVLEDNFSGRNYPSALKGVLDFHPWSINLDFVKYPTCDSSCQAKIDAFLANITGIKLTDYGNDPEDYHFGEMDYRDYSFIRASSFVNSKGQAIDITGKQVAGQSRAFVGLDYYDDSSKIKVSLPSSAFVAKNESWGSGDLGSQNAFSLGRAKNENQSIKMVYNNSTKIYSLYNSVNALMGTLLNIDSIWLGTLLDGWPSQSMIDAYEDESVVQNISLDLGTVSGRNGWVPEVRVGKNINLNMSAQDPKYVQWSNPSHPEHYNPWFLRGELTSVPELLYTPKARKGHTAIDIGAYNPNCSLASTPEVQVQKGQGLGQNVDNLCGVKVLNLISQADDAPEFIHITSSLASGRARGMQIQLHQREGSEFDPISETWTRTKPSHEVKLRIDAPTYFDSTELSYVSIGNGSCNIKILNRAARYIPGVSVADHSLPPEERISMCDDASKVQYAVSSETLSTLGSYDGIGFDSRGTIVVYETPENLSDWALKCYVDGANHFYTFLVYKEGTEDQRSISTMVDSQFSVDVAGTSVNLGICGKASDFEVGGPMEDWELETGREVRSCSLLEAEANPENCGVNVFIEIRDKSVHNIDNFLD